MISKTGDNLDVVILTRTAEDWRAFACWYSVSKNLPDANVSLICHRSTKVEFQFYQWAKRLRLKHCYVNPFCNEQTGDRLADIGNSIQRGFSRGTTLLLDYTTVVVDMFNDDWIKTINDPEPRLFLAPNGALARNMPKPQIDLILDKYMFTGSFGEFPVERRNLFPEAKDECNPSSIVSTTKGCGRWIDSMKGCPFSNADGLLSDDIKVNELRVIGLWRKMVALYSAVN